MKVLITSLVICLVTGGLFLIPQQKVPPNILKAFTERFPDIKASNWENEGNGTWEAEFKIRKLEYSVLFDQNGRWLETEHAIQKSEVPRQVLLALAQAFPEHEVEEMESLETPDGQRYEFELENGAMKLEVLMDEQGSILKKESGEEEDEND